MAQAANEVCNSSCNSESLAWACPKMAQVANEVCNSSCNDESPAWAHPRMARVANEVCNSGSNVNGCVQAVHGDMMSSGAAPDSLAASADPAAALPEKRTLPPFPEGDVTQEEGERLCKMICDAYPEVFDGKKVISVEQKPLCTSKRVIWRSY